MAVRTIGIGFLLRIGFLDLLDICILLTALSFLLTYFLVPTSLHTTDHVHMHFTAYHLLRTTYCILLITYYLPRHLTALADRCLAAWVGCSGETSWGGMWVVEK